MPQKKSKAQKAADKAFIAKIKTIGLNLGSAKQVEVVESEGPPICDACKGELEADGDPVGFLAGSMHGKTVVGPVYKSRHKKKREPAAEEQSFAA